MPKNRSNEPYRAYVLWGLNLPKKIGYENSLVVQNGYTHIQFYFLCTSCADLCLICLLQVWCFFRIVPHKNVRCFLRVAVFQLVFTHSGSFDSTPWKAIVIFSGGTPGVPTIPNHPAVLAFNFHFKIDQSWFFSSVWPRVQVWTRGPFSTPGSQSVLFPTNWRTRGKNK